MRLFLLLLVLSGELLAQSFSATQMGYTYTLPVDSSNVTIGVKDSTGALIRTISAGTYRNAGTYSGVWDGNTDAGVAATGGPFTVAVLYGNPSYTFNGVIGDTSENLSGWDRWSNFWAVPTSARLAFVGGVGWAASGYAEGTQGLGYFADGDPNRPHVVNITYGFNAFINWGDITTDGTYLYLANQGNSAGGWAWVTKLDAKTGFPAFFTDPSIYACTPNTYVAGTCTGMVMVGPPIGSFPTGSGAVAYTGGVTMTDIDVYATPSGQPAIAPPTSIAVQATGNILAVGHGNYMSGVNTAWSPPNVTTNNVIKFFDKTTGLAIGTNATIANPTSMAFNSAGLWAIGDGHLYLVTGPSTTNTVTQPIAGLSYPMAVDANQSTNHIYVLDGGTSQQLKEFDASYTLVRTYGVPGGYTDCNPTVASNRLLLDGRAIYGTNGGNPYFGNLNQTMPSVRAEANGDVWVSDQFTYWSVYPQTAGFVRIQHLTPSGNTFNYVNQILKMGYNYTGTASHNAPSRLMISWLEFQVNWDIPNNPGDPTVPGGNNSWQLVRNWAIGAGGASCGFTPPWTFGMSRPPTLLWADQLSNGRFYGIIVQGSLAPAVGGAWLVEFPSSGTSAMRYIGPAPTGASTTVLNIARNGDIHYYTNTGTGPGATQNLWVKPFMGFDSNNNPLWGTASLIQAVTYNQATQPTMANSPWGSNLSSIEPTVNGVYPGTQWTTYFSRAGGATNYAGYPHTAGILPGRNTYMYGVTPEVCSTYALTNGSYPCGAGSGNLGSGTFVEGHQFVVAYGSQASLYAPQFWHYWEDGMFVGQFGGWHTNSWTPTGPNVIIFGNTSVYGNQGNQPRYTTVGAALGWKGAEPQLLGYVENVGSAHTITSPAGNIFLILNNEASNAPTAVWKLSNLSSIHEMAGTGTLGQSVNVNTPVF